MVLFDVLILHHLLQTFVEALRAQPLMPLILQLLASLEKNIIIYKDLTNVQQEKCSIFASALLHYYEDVENVGFFFQCLLIPCPVLFSMGQ